MLELCKVSVSYGSREAVRNMSLRVEAGQWLMLVGPNGAGKSTLIEAIAQGVPYTGRILLDGQDIRQLKASDRARAIGVLSQKNSVSFAYTVEEVISLGRYAYRKGFLRSADRDGPEYTRQALRMTGLDELRHASVTALSGGELQRVFLAQVFAQDPRILLLDEPANHLDLQYMQHIFALIGQWLRTPGRAVVSVVHDLSLARRYGTHAALMNKGSLTASGRIDEVLAPERLQDVYGLDVFAFMRETLSLWQG